MDLRAEIRALGRRKVLTGLFMLFLHGVGQRLRRRDFRSGQGRTVRRTGTMPVPMAPRARAAA